MVPLDSAQASAAFELYRGNAAFFPLIGAVLQGEQPGRVYGDAAVAPSQFYVEHAFGFAQAFGASLPGFEAALERYLLADKAFGAPKVRLYTPQLPAFLAGPAGTPLRSERQRFRLRDPAQPEAASGFTPAAVDSLNFDAVEQAFGVAVRFWPTGADFIAKAQAVVALRDGAPAAICYAAAVADGRAEIDVLTLPQHRQQGAGRFAVAHFVQRCRERKIEPLWDCFSNNAGSVQLCLAAGFAPAAPPYPFFTISK